jgi:CRISPR-associated endonuclease/helicase Cas3
MSKEYHYQKQVQEAFFREEDIILVAPAGAGKTRASVSPALQAWRDLEPHETPPRIVLGAPVRTLVSGHFNTLHKSATQNDWESYLLPSIQTGDYNQDTLFEKRVIVTTVDQIVAANLSLPYGVPKRLDNINVGAFIGAYYIFDEVHLYPRDEMLLSVLALLKMQEDISRFCIMSATLSSVMVNAISSYLGATTIMDDPETDIAQGIFYDVDNIQTQKRVWHTHEGELSAQTVLNLRGNRTIVICNRVERIQKLYHQVKEENPNILCILLHSQFYSQDRQRAEEILKDKKFESTDNIILFATQVIEVGLDISCDVMLTECAPASSIIQRVGRCARRKDSSGEVHIFLPYDTQGQVNFMPYATANDHSEGDNLETICWKTWHALNDSRIQGQWVQYHDERWLITQAHQADDEAFVFNLESKIRIRIDEITQCLSTPEDGYLNIIRKNTTVPVYIHDSPDKSDMMTRMNPRPQGFSLTRGRLYHYFQQFTDKDIEAEFIMCGCNGESIEQPTEGDDIQTSRIYKWVKLKNPQDIYQYRWFVLHSKVVQYTKDGGLLLEYQEDAPPADISPEGTKQQGESISYTADLYEEHIQGLYQAYTLPYHSKDKSYTPLRDEFVYPLYRLCKKMNKAPEDGEKIMRLIIALHDVGKLNQPWQKWAQAWQEHYGNFMTGYSPSIVAHTGNLAHTDLDLRDPNQKAMQKTFKHPQRGNHAVESARASLAVVDSLTSGDNDWYFATLCAIMHHHTPQASEFSKFEMVANADLSLQKSIIACGFSEEEAQTFISQLNRKFSGTHEDITSAWHGISPNLQRWLSVYLYFLMVRILRLCDQRSFDYLRKYRNL